MKLQAVFIGTVEFSKAALQKLLELKDFVEITGVITREYTTFHSDYADLKPLCKQYGIKCRVVTNINASETVQWIREQEPDVLFVFGWSQILRPPILAIPKIGAIGYHPAKLPQNRGRHPLIWALALGLTETGSTFFFLDEGADSGDILSQQIVPISYDDTARTLYDRIVQTALQQIEEFVPQLATGNYSRIPQNHQLANYWRKRTEKDGEIDFRMSSRAIYNLVRALTRPYPGAHCVYNGEKVKVWAVAEERVTAPNIEPGKVLAHDNGAVLVKCYDHAVWLVEHELQEIPPVGAYF